MVQAVQQIRFAPTPRQYTALQKLHDQQIRAVLYGGAKGGGKSHLLCWQAFMDAMEDIPHFGLKPSKYPPVTSWMGRRRAIDFRKTTLETFKRVVPQGLCRILEQKSEIIINGSVKIAYGGLDDQDSIDKFNSAEFCRIYGDQAEEFDQDAVACLRGALRLKVNGKEPKHGYTEFYTANPRNCWLLPEFIENPDEAFAFIQALPSDNPYLPDSYVDTLTKAFGHRPELLKAYLYGSWEVFEDADQLISRSWLQQANTRHFMQADRRVVIAVDVARFGDDNTSIYVLSETDIIDKLQYGDADLMETVRQILLMRKKHNNPLVVVDAGGVGAGVIDRLNELGVKLRAFDGASQSSQPDRYYNLRAEAWWEGARTIKEACDLQSTDRGLWSDLTAPKYSLRGSRVLIEDKAEIKKRIGRSPDKGDAYIMGLWGLQHAWCPNPIRRQEDYRDKYDESNTLDPMAI